MPLGRAQQAEISQRPLRIGGNSGEERLQVLGQLLDRAGIEEIGVVFNCQVQ
jgi:hypothetical protein